MHRSVGLSVMSGYVSHVAQLVPRRRGLNSNQLRNRRRSQGSQYGFGYAWEGHRTPSKLQYGSLWALTRKLWSWMLKSVYFGRLWVVWQLKQLLPTKRLMAPPM